MSKKTLAPALLAAALIMLPSLASAQTPPPPDGPIDANIRKETVETLAREMEAAYVFADKGKQVAEDLRGRLKRGEYDKLDQAQAFAKALTEHIQAPTRDKHLRVTFSDSEITIPPARRDPTPTELAEQLEQLRFFNFGVDKIERLPGNIGYIDLRGFNPHEPSQASLSAAMNLLAHSNALIIDLTKNGGGDPKTVAHITSYLMDGRVHLNDLVWREEGKERVESFFTNADVPGARYGGKKPVYVLTSKNTFSAAEEFSYNLKNLKRATLVGEATGGGAHPGRRFKLSKNFGAFIATGRARNPISQTNWEGAGVSPDVAVAADQALNTAQRLALRPIIDADTQPRRKALLEARLKKLEEEAVKK
jgi:retinol-binding protein 3